MELLGKLESLDPPWDYLQTPQAPLAASCYVGFLHRSEQTCSEHCSEQCIIWQIILPIYMANYMANIWQHIWQNIWAHMGPHGPDRPTIWQIYGPIGPIWALWAQPWQGHGQYKLFASCPAAPSARNPQRRCVLEKTCMQRT